MAAEEKKLEEASARAVETGGSLLDEIVQATRNQVKRWSGLPRGLLTK